MRNTALVDTESLAAYVERRLPGIIRRPLDVERHQAGHSNETFFVSTGERRWVLRRPPRGAFLPTAHDVSREFRVLSALAGTPVRAPRPVLWCDDPGVIGAPFYLMERIDGVVIRDAMPGALDADPGARRRIGEELVDTLVDLHAVDWREVGLQSFGKPQGYLDRQVRRWRGQLTLTEPLTRHLPELHRTADWLQAHLPMAGAGRREGDGGAGGSREADATIVHGDYKLDNVCFASDPPIRLAAVFDWEMSTLGDPLADLGWMLALWREPGDPVESVLDELTASRLPGFASRADLLARYRQRSGRNVDDERLRFYQVLALWKLAVLLEGSYARHLMGAADDPFFGRLEEGVPAVARRAWDEATG